MLYYPVLVMCTESVPLSPYNIEHTTYNGVLRTPYYMLPYKSTAWPYRFGLFHLRETNRNIQRFDDRISHLF
ncbi:hypothetical protein ACN38_g7880 [Penicillium nordicum]|uniref:Uncharacterized protein n=1 Tax=Penicillium nordicum TaxID=229535 RepID=A0A0M8NY72_9EURO|nr:hypothetical protein ACN38_g7880 [Penicillium nordicum]